MNDLKSVITARKYAVELSIDDMISLEEGDSLLINKEFDDTSQLHTQLENMKGVSIYEIEFNGHFGPYIFFTVNDDDDTPVLHDRIHKMIRKHIKHCKKVIEENKENKAKRKLELGY